MEKKQINTKDYPTLIILLFFSIIFVFFNSKSSPLYLFNEWGDANVYFTIGKGMLNGLVPYKDIFDHKGPLIFSLYSLAYIISNDTFIGVYFLECIFLFINLIFAYKLARVYLNKQYSFITSLIYAVFIFTKTYRGGSAEEFISVFVIISFYYFILYFTNKQSTDKEVHKHMLIHGVMFTLAFLSKLSVCVFWMPLLLAIVYDSLASKKFKEFFVQILYFLIGSGLIILPFLIYFLSHNALNDFYFGYIEFNSIYAEFKPDLELVKKVFFHIGKLLKTNYISFPVTLLGVFVLSFSNKYINKWHYKAAILISFILSFVTICLSKYIMSYAHIVIYVYAILGAIFIFELLIKNVIKSQKSYTFVLITSFILALVIGINDKEFFKQDRDCLLRKKECNYMQKEFASIINKESNPTLLDLGLDHGLYTKTGILPTYKYFFYPNIVYRLYPDIRDYQTSLIENKEPTFIVVGNTSMYYPYYKDLDALKENYDLISTFYQDIEAFDTEVYLYKRKNP